MARTQIIRNRKCPICGDDLSQANKRSTFYDHYYYECEG